MTRPKVPYSKRDPARVSYDAKHDRYYRQEGVRHTKSESLSSQKFYLGSDEMTARKRAHKIHQLWQEAMAGGVATWSDDFLSLAKALAKGEARHTVTIGKGPGQIRRLISSERSADGKTLSMKVNSNESVRKRFENSVLPVVVRSHWQVGLPFLHNVLEECAKYVLEDKQRHGKTTDYGKNLSEQVKRLKDSHRDIELISFKFDEIGAMATYWKNRPNRKTTTNPISPSTVKAQISAIRYFVRWLHRKTKHEWKCPNDWEEATRYNADDLLSDEEVAALGNQIPVYDVAELATIYKYATDYEKLFVLLALNCGFAQSEIISLRAHELHLDGDLPLIKRVRIKNRVYGQLALWPETVQGLRGQTKGRDLKPADLVFQSNNEKPLTSQRIANKWNALIERIQKDDKGFRYLSFKYFRKTAAQMVQTVAGEIVAKVFLFHGKRVRGGELLDRYTNRDWESVYRANHAVRAMLQPMFDGSPDAFRRGKLKGGGNISLGTVERIRHLYSEKVKPSEIARIVGVSRATVYRHIASPNPDGK